MRQGRRNKEPGDTTNMNESTKMRKRRDETSLITLALQGGGTHGAFTWGVLERILEDERLVIEAISGTSAGAMNAAVLADGFEKGGATGAKQALENFWRTMSRYGAFSHYFAGPASPFAGWFESLTRTLSPYQFNPFDINPLRDVLANTIDFDCVRRCQQIKLYISATNVRTNRLHIFTGAEFSVEALLASACLPHIQQAIEIDGEHYWDGGFMGNPVLEPLVGQCRSCDIVIVQVNPICRDAVPRTVEDITNRVNEISFNSSLLRELRAIAWGNALVEAGVMEIKDARYRCIRFHRIAAEDVMSGLGVRSKFDTSWPFLLRLRELGRERADRWLAEHFKDLGNRSTVDPEDW